MADNSGICGGGSALEPLEVTYIGGALAHGGLQLNLLEYLPKGKEDCNHNTSSSFPTLVRAPITQIPGHSSSFDLSPLSANASVKSTSQLYCNSSTSMKGSLVPVLLPTECQMASS